MADDILKLIDKAVEEKTFSLEGLGAVQKIKEQAGVLQKRVEALEAELDRAKTFTSELRNVIVARDTEISVLKGRETAVAARELKMFELEKATAVAEAVRLTIDTMFTRMFANRQYRENIMDSHSKAIPPVPGSGMTYPTMHTESATRTVEREDK
jgi:hypothetical protein